MTTQEERAAFGGEKFGGGLRDAQFRAAGVGDQGVSRSVACDFGEKIECRTNGQRDVDKVGIAQGGSQIARKRFVDGIAGLCDGQDVGAIPAADAEVGRVLA